MCTVIRDTVMCSCFPGYAIMADGVSCEGECHLGATTQLCAPELACSGVERDRQAECGGVVLA